jgi:calcium/calmodulin-dependent protein kinase I
VTAVEDNDFFSLTRSIMARQIVSKGLIKDRKAARTHLDFVRSLDHPHVVRLLAWFEGRKNFYSVFELAAGGELFDRIQNEGPYGDETSREIIKAILDGVRYLHRRLVVHRDIKPENILVRYFPVYYIKRPENLTVDCSIVRSILAIS